MLNGAVPDWFAGEEPDWAWPPRRDAYYVGRAKWFAQGVWVREILAHAIAFGAM